MDHLLPLEQTPPETEPSSELHDLKVRVHVLEAALNGLLDHVYGANVRPNATEDVEGT